MTEIPLWATIMLPFVGYAVAIGTEALRNRWQAQRELRQRTALRRDLLDDRRDQFELETLKDTYSALDRLARAAMRFHLLDLSVAKKTGGKYAAHQLGSLSGPELDEEFRLATRDLISRIRLLLDDEIRLVAMAAYEGILLPSSMHNSDVKEAERSMGVALAKINRAHEFLSARIRELYKA